jgi:hypothetical protein
MRWLGLARRSLEIAGAYIAERESGGKRLGERESVQLLMGDAAMRVRTGRLLVMHAASKLDAGAMARNELSMAKVHVADALHQAVDTAIQLCGGARATRRTRRSSGSIATRARRGSSTARPKSTARSSRVISPRTPTPSSTGTASTVRSGRGRDASARARSFRARLEERRDLGAQSRPVGLPRQSVSTRPSSRSSCACCMTAVGGCALFACSSRSCGRRGIGASPPSVAGRAPWSGSGGA